MTADLQLSQLIQLSVVVVVVALAAVYVARTFLRQFHHSDDEVSGCASCPANTGLDRRRRDNT